MKHRLRASVRTRWQRWLDQRLPRVKQIHLTQRNTFIFPGEEGFVFLAVVMLIFIGGINYENSLMLGTAFLLASLFLVTIVSTFLNLSGITIRADRAEPAYVGELAFIEVSLRGTKDARYGLTLMLGDYREVVHLPAGGEVSVLVPFAAEKRGKGFPPRILMESRYPLGLVRAWTWLALDQFAVIYPKPLRCDLQAGGEGEQGKKQTVRQQQDEEFAGIREYRPGDPLKFVHWKQFAKSGELYSRYREGATAATLVLSLDCVPGPGIEARLGQLTWWAKELTSQQIPFALKLPGVQLAVASGPQHLFNALNALALHALDG